MTKTTNQTKMILKKLSVIPILASAVFIFSSRTQAQEKIAVKPTTAAVPFSQEGASQEWVNELNAIIDKHRTVTRNGHKIIGRLSEDETQRVQTIFLKMSKEQQNASPVVLMKRKPFKPSGQPTEAQFESWKNAAKYGVWINGKKVNNSALDKYTAADIGDYSVSNLNYTEEMKQNVMKSFNLTSMYEKQLDLMTKEETEKYIKSDAASFKNNPYWMGFSMKKVK